jgi:hypothetical protein
MGGGKWPVQEEVWVGEGIQPGFNKKASLKFFFSDLSFKIQFELNLNFKKFGTLQGLLKTGELLLSSSGP